jgi:hypothetical protein
VALGYRTTANNDYSVALGYRASNNTHTGTMVMGDESTTDSVRNQADNEFRIRYNGGIRLRVSTAANGNTPGAGGNVGCDLTVAVPSWTCASSRTLKENYRAWTARTCWRAARAPHHHLEHDRRRPQRAPPGPVAEDFYQPSAWAGRDHDRPGRHRRVNLAAAKALEARTTDCGANWTPAPPKSRRCAAS